MPINFLELFSIKDTICSMKKTLYLLPFICLWFSLFPMEPQRTNTNNSESSEDEWDLDNFHEVENKNYLVLKSSKSRLSKNILTQFESQKIFSQNKYNQALLLHVAQNCGLSITVNDRANDDRILSLLKQEIKTNASPTDHYFINCHNERDNLQLGEPKNSDEFHEKFFTEINSKIKSIRSTVIAINSSVKSLEKKISDLQFNANIDGGRASILSKENERLKTTEINPLKRRSFLTGLLCGIGITGLYFANSSWYINSLLENYIQFDPSAINNYANLITKHNYLLHYKS